MMQGNDQDMGCVAKPFNLATVIYGKITVIAD